MAVRRTNDHAFWGIIMRDDFDTGWHIYLGFIFMIVVASVMTAAWTVRLQRDNEKSCYELTKNLKCFKAIRGDK